MIPVVWKEYTAILSGSVFKFVDCEKCKQKYVYQMVRLVQGQGSSLYFLDNQGAENRAQEQASAKLQRQLEQECEAVPCINCGWHQPEMVAKMRREYRSWIFYCGAGLLGITFLLAALAYILFAVPDPSPTAGKWLLVVGGTLAFAGLCAMGVRKHLAARFDPNATPEVERIRIGQELAITMEEFANWQREQGGAIEPYGR